MNLTAHVILTAVHFVARILNLLLQIHSHIDVNTKYSTRSVVNLYHDHLFLTRLFILICLHHKCCALLIFPFTIARINSNIQAIN